VISSLGSEVVILPQSSLFYRRLLNFNLKRADRITATSAFLARETATYCPDQTPVVTVPFGVDTAHFSTNGRSYSNEKPVVIGTVKILEQNYGIDRLIKAFHKVVTESAETDLSLLIVGGGSMEGALKKLGHRLGLSDRITFVGNLPHEKVMDYLNLIDIFVSLPESETFGVSVVEASSCGIPSVVANVGGLPEVVDDGVTGYLVDPLDTATTADRILSLVGDSRQRQRMGTAARTLVSTRYDWAKTARSMESIYDELVDEKAGVAT
jgi:glycosyltransferase involved in cell wall biosynthesis